MKMEGIPAQIKGKRKGKNDGTYGDGEYARLYFSLYHEILRLIKKRKEGIEKSLPHSL